MLHQFRGAEAPSFSYGEEAPLLPFLNKDIHLSVEQVENTCVLFLVLAQKMS